MPVETAPVARRSRREDALATARALARRVDWSSGALALVAVGALLLRLYDLNWDSNTHLHPDERKITMVAMCLGWRSVPAGCPAVPDPANPHFFAYGSFPMYLLALVANGLAHVFANHPGLPTDGGVFNDYNHITLVGRALSALFDTGTVLVAGLMARRLAGRWWGVFAAAFVALTTFEIQVSHFYAVDTVLTFFTTLTLFGALGLALQKPGPRVAAALEAGDAPPLRDTIAWSLLTAVAFGLALSSKISAAPLLLPVGLALVIRWRRLGPHGWPDVLLAGLLIVAVTLGVVVATMPYAFLDPTSFWHDVNEQSNLANGTIVYPYTIQFAGRIPYLDQLSNLFQWDMGFPMAAAGCAGALYALWRVIRRWDDPLLIPLTWVVVYFGITGGFYTKFTRYQLPNFPILAVFAAVGLAALWHSAPGWRWWRAVGARLGRHWPRFVAGGLAGIILASGLVLSLAFLNMYAEPMTRIAASEWIYQHLPAGSAITDEIWDDSLPLPVNNQAPYAYQHIDLNLYSADTTAKAATLAQQLASANAIVLSSNRLRGSITRVPWLYPMTSRYYSLLFQDKLGFHLAATFANHPNLGPFQFPDSAADESFSVYDHPTVWIFTRDATPLSAADIQATLLAGVNPLAASSALASQKPLLLSARDLAADSQSPPLWQRFDPRSLASRAALPLWWLAIEALGLLAFPLVFLALPGLRDRGWGVAKALGLLLLSYLVWLPASLGIIPYERGTVWLAFVALAGAGGAVAWWRRRELRAFFRERWRFVVATELLTLGAYLAFCAVRAADPDLWHLWFGGEKPMELAFLNAILRSRTLPPLDPWFAGGSINYYYFGQFLIATVIQLTTIVPTTAFNLAIPTLFALTIAGAVSVVGGITGRWWVGLTGAWAVAVAGNLDGLSQVIQRWQTAQAGKIPAAFNYWQSSRVIPYTINEFPYWSFLYADLHAHVIDLPIIMLGLAVAASTLALPPDAPRRDRWPGLALGALTIGAMACVNTWDAPTYGLVILVAWLAAEWRSLHALAGGGGWSAWRPWLTWSRTRRVAGEILTLGGGAIALYLPFYTHFQSFYGKTGPVTTPTDPYLFLMIFGVWIFLVVTFFLVEIADRWSRAVVERGWFGFGDSAQRVLTLCLVAALLLTVAVLSGVKVLLGGLLLVGIALALDGRHPPRKQLTYLVTLVGLAVALVVEFVYLRDFLDNSPWERMNTVFKFYYQAWVLLALGAGLILGELLPRVWAAFAPLAALVGRATPVPWGAAVVEEHGDALEATSPAVWEIAAEPLARERPGDPVILWSLRGAWLATLAVLIFGASIFVVAGTAIRTQDRAAWAVVQPPVNPLPATPSLDGFAYMYAWYPGDAAAITWLNEHIGGAPVILEASADPYQWYGRVSIYTGLPAVLGWASHESQQRYLNDVYARQPDVGTMYSAGDPALVLPLLHKYAVRYIYVGQLECLTYAVHDPHPTTPTTGNVQTCAAANDLLGPLTVFGQMVSQGTLRQVYQSQGVTIYEVIG